MMISPDTDGLIRTLARQAGTSQGPDAATFERRFLIAAALSLAVAVALVFALIGIRPDFAAAAQRAPFLYKIASTLALAVGGFLLARRAAQPGGARPSLLALLPGLFLLALRAATDGSGLIGHSGVSPQACVGAILLVSMPALAIILGALRSGAPTRPGLAGALAGLLSGALGAAAYALACVNDGGLFVAVWYPVAILIVAGIGAVCGRRSLAW
jgi:hypothetical protein